MTGVQFTTYIRRQTKTNATTFTDDDIVLYANTWKDEIAKRITKANEDYFGIFMTRNLVAGQRNYAFESQQLNHMKYLEAKLDGVAWCPLVEYDINSLRIPSNETDIQLYFASRSPGFDIFGNELVILNGAAIPDVTDGLKLWTIVYPRDITTLMLADAVADLSEPPTSIDFGLPRQFHKLWADSVVVEYKNSQETPIPLTVNEQLVPTRLAETVNDIKGENLDRSTESTVPTDDGQDY